MRLPLLALTLLLVACGSDEDEEVLRLRTATGSHDFLEPEARVDASAEPVELSVCGRRNPELKPVDGSSSLCAWVQLEGARVAALSPGTSLRILGSAVAPADFVTGRVPFLPGEGHAPEVVAAWISTQCFGPVRDSGAAQQLRGTLLLETHGAAGWRGRLELHMDGEAGGVSCVQGVQGADVDVSFEAPPTHAAGL